MKQYDSIWRPIVKVEYQPETIEGKKRNRWTVFLECGHTLHEHRWPRDSHEMCWACEKERIARLKQNA